MFNINLIRLLLMCTVWIANFNPAHAQSKYYGYFVTDAILKKCVDKTAVKIDISEKYILSEKFYDKTITDFLKVKRFQQYSNSEFFIMRDFEHDTIQRRFHEYGILIEHTKRTRNWTAYLFIKNKTTKKTEILIFNDCIDVYVIQRRKS